VARERCGVNSGRWPDDGTWQVTIWAQEFFRSDAQGVELRERVVRALECRWDYQRHRARQRMLDVYGTPAGEALTRAAANFVDGVAHRLREAMGLA
jgi:hypothetical protein